MTTIDDTTLPAVKYRGVKIYTSANGVYAYHRKTRTRLAAAVGTPEFQAELDALNGDGRTSDKPAIGTLAGLVEKYRSDADFRNLAPRTRKDYERVFLFIRPGAEKKLLMNMRPKDVVDIRNLADQKHKRHFANYCVTVLRLLFTWAANTGYVDRNPLAGTKKLKIKRPHGMPKANRRWADYECEAVLDAAKGGVKVAIALGMFTGMREGDVLQASRANYDGRLLTWVQGKTSTPVRLPVAPRLREILDASLAARGAGGDPTLVLNGKGQPYTPDGFRTMLWKLIHKLEVAREVMPGLTFHGLRHTAATALADLGASPHEIAAMLGQKTLTMAALYSAEANRHKLGAAAVNRLIEAANNRKTGELTDGNL